QTAWSSTTALHAQGRSLDVAVVNAVPGLDLAVLAAMAHQVGVDFVANLAGAQIVRLSFSGGADLDLGTAATIAPGDAIPLSVLRPIIANPSALSFRIVRCGPGNGALSVNPADPAGAIFTGSTIGRVTVVASYRLAAGAILLGSRTIDIAPKTLD